MSAFIDRRARILRIPQTANVRIALEAIERHAFFHEGPRHDQAGGTGADDAIVLLVGGFDSGAHIMMAVARPGDLGIGIRTLHLQPAGIQ